MTKIFNIILAAAFIATTFAQKWNYSCEMTETMIKNNAENAIISCKCTATYQDKKIEMKCDDATTPKGGICSGSPIHSDDKSVSAAIIGCGIGGATIETNKKGEDYKEDSFKLNCSSRSDGQSCRGTFTQA